jgi:predicted transcriptional regulator
MIDMLPMIPEAEHIKKEMILRNMALPDEVRLTRKSLVRWIALSLGLISPNETRTIVIDVLDVLLDEFSREKKPTTKEIHLGVQKKRKDEVCEKTIYYHLQRLAAMGLLQREKGQYFISKDKEKLKDSVRKVYAREFDEAFEKIGKALDTIEK